MIHVRIMCMMYLLWLVYFEIDGFTVKKREKKTKIKRKNWLLLLLLLADIVLVTM